MAFNKITFDIKQTQFLLDPGEEYTITLDDGFLLDEQYTANLPLDFYTFIAPPVVIDAQLLYIGSKIKGVKLTFDREINYNNGNIFLYYEDSTLLQTWAANDLLTSWSIMPGRTEVELYIEVAGELVDRTFFIILEDDVFYSDDRVLTKTASWADSSIDFQYVGQHLQNLVLNNPTTQSTAFSLSSSLNLAPYQYDKRSPLNGTNFQGISGNNNYTTLASVDSNINGVPESEVYVYTSDNSVLTYTLSDPSIGNDSFFGVSTATNNSYVLVGAYGAENANGDRTGLAYVFDLTDGSLKYTLAPTSADTSQQFGRKVAMTDDYFIVSSHNDNPADPNPATYYYGSVYVYNVSDGSLAYKITNPNPNGGGFSNPDDDFGLYGLAANDSYLCISAPDEDYASSSATESDRSGKVYIYDISNGTYLRTLENPNPVGDPFQDFFGRAMVLDNGTGTTLYVMAPDEDAVTGDYVDLANQDNAGKIYVFNVSTGALLDTIDNPLYTTNETRLAAVLDANNDYLFTGLSNGTILILDKTTYNVVQTIYHTPTPNYAASIRSIGIVGENIIYNIREYNASESPSEYFQGYIYKKAGT